MPELTQLEIVEADPNSATKKPESKKKDGIPKTPIEITAAIKAGYYNTRIKAPPAAALDESESLESGQVEIHRSYKANQAPNKNIKTESQPRKEPDSAQQPIKRSSALRTDSESSSDEETKQPTRKNRKRT
jgi:hypothetical protein